MSIKEGGGRRAPHDARVNLHLGGGRGVDGVRGVFIGNAAVEDLHGRMPGRREARRRVREAHDSDMSYQ